MPKFEVWEPAGDDRINARIFEGDFDVEGVAEDYSDKFVEASEIGNKGFLHVLVATDGGDPVRVRVDVEWDPSFVARIDEPADDAEPSR